MTAKDLILAGLLIAVAGLALLLIVERRRRGHGAEPRRRILFPFAGHTLSLTVLDATLRLARAERAQLVPAYLATIPLRIPLEAPIPRQADEAIALLETIEQRAARQGVPVDARIEPGRTYRHALTRLMAREPHDRVVIGVAAGGAIGLDPADAAWLLEHGDSEIVVLRPKP